MTLPIRPRHGYTLMELIVVLVLIGVLLTVVTPAFTRINEGQTGTTVVLRALESARATSLSQAAQVDVIIDPASARIWVRSDRTNPRLDTTYTLSLPPSDTLFARSPRVRFSFRADGTVWGDEIGVRSGSKSTRIDVASLDGAISAPAVLNGPPQ